MGRTGHQAHAARTPRVWTKPARCLALVADSECLAEPTDGVLHSGGYMTPDSFRFLAPVPRAPFLFFGALPTMLEVSSGQDGYTVYDEADGEAVMRFSTRRDADSFVAELAIADMHAQLQSWSLDKARACSEHGARNLS